MDVLYSVYDQLKVAQLVNKMLVNYIVSCKHTLDSLFSLIASKVDASEIIISVLLGGRRGEEVKQ